MSNAHALDVFRLHNTTALETMAAEAAGITGADGAAIVVGDSSAMCCCASAGEAPDVGVVVGPDSGLSGTCLRTGEVVQCDDTASDPRIDARTRGLMSLRSALIVPVFVEGRLQAMLEVFSSRPRAFQAQHRDDLSRMTPRIAAVLSGGDRKQQPKAATREEPASARVAEGAVPSAGTATPAAGGVSAGRESTAAAPARDRSAELRRLPLPAPLPEIREPRSTALASASSPHHAAGQTEAKRSLSPTAKAAIAVALLAVLAVGWYLIGGVRASSRAATVSAPGTHKAEQPAPLEMSVEQSSLSVAGLEQAPKVIGAAPQLTPGKLLVKVAPTYPASTRAGAIVLIALVTKDGKVTNVQFVRGPQELATPAMDAVRQWVYEPYRLGGVPVAVEAMIEIKFAPKKLP